MSKRSDRIQSNPLKSLPLVVLIHAVPALLLSLLPETQIPDYYELQTIDLKKIRTVGVEGGSKLGFLGKDINLAAPAVGTKPEKAAKAINEEIQTEVPKELQSEDAPIDPAKLAQRIVEDTFLQNKDSQLSLVPAGRARSRTFTYSEAKKSRFRQNLRSDLQNIAVHSRREMELLDKSNLQISFTAPEGVDLDELNQLEQIFYGFNVRIYKTYVNSLISSHLKFFQENPHKEITDVRPEVLRAKVTFDKDGSVERVKIIRWSENDDIQEVFQRSLENIKSIPNPPKAFVKNKDHFNLYFNLVIQG